MLTRDEKKKLVIELYEKGTPWDEISDKVNMSNREISEIIKEYDPSKRKLSPRTKALNLFASGNTILEVIIALDMPYEEARIVEGQYLAIQNRSKLSQLYDQYENKDYIDSILRLFNLAKERNLGLEEIEDIIYSSRQIPELQEQLNSLIKEVSHQEKIKSRLNSEILALRIVKYSLSMKISQIESQINYVQRHVNELILIGRQLGAKIAIQMNLIQSGSNKLDELTQNISSNIFGKQEPILKIMFYCVINYLRNSQDRQLIKHIFDSDNAESQNTEYTLQSNSKLDEMFKDICASFRGVLLKIVEICINSNQSGRLSPGTKNVGNS